MQQISVCRVHLDHLKADGNSPLRRSLEGGDYAIDVRGAEFNRCLRLVVEWKRACTDNRPSPLI